MKKISHAEFSALGIRQGIINHRLFTVSLLIVNIIFWILFYTERSFGGDFWLHLWLIKIQENSFTSYGIPALLASFNPAGALSTAPLFTGGISYSLAGLLNSLGLSTYWAAISLALLALDIAFISCYSLLQNFNLPRYLSLAMAFIPLTFGFVIGDGFGRGGLSSMVAGLFGIAAICLLVKILISKSISTLLVVFCGILVFFATSTHLPSAIIFGIFSMPMILISGMFWKNKISKNGIVLSLVATLSGFCISAIYLIPTLTWALQASNQATQTEPFQLGASKYFADPFYQWNLMRLVPPGHIDFWTDQTSDGSATSLITTLPSLLYLVIIAGCFVSLIQNKFKLLLPALVPLSITTILLIFPDIWTFFPYALRSLQYSFRISYAIIPWLMIGLALIAEQTSSHKWKILIRAWIVCSVIICSTQSFIQLATTTNLSILPTNDPLKRFVRDVAPSEMLIVSSPNAFWYSAGEQKAIDMLQENIDASGCSLFNTVEKWPYFPAVQEVTIPKEQTCAYFSMNLPISWLKFDNAKVLGRDPDTLNVIVKSIDKNYPIQVSMNRSNPLNGSLVISFIGIGILGLIPFMNRKLKKSI